MQKLTKIIKENKIWFNENILSWDFLPNTEITERTPGNNFILEIVKKWEVKKKKSTTNFKKEKATSIKKN